jgi:hypothetical protein
MYILEKGLCYQRLILIVQEKPYCPVSETGLSSFHGFKPPGQNLPPSPFLTFLSLTHQSNREGDPKPPLVIRWFLRGILEFLGEINPPRTGVSIPPTSFPHLKVFSPNPRSPCPMDGFEIPLVHCLPSCHRTIPYNISKFTWINRSDL